MPIHGPNYLKIVLYTTPTCSESRGREGGRCKYCKMEKKSHLILSYSVFISFSYSILCLKNSLNVAKLMVKSLFKHTRTEVLDRHLGCL